jgi:tagatose 6-phosphate kinase
LYRIKPPAIEILNTVGSGDAFVAGMAVAMAENKPIEECLRLATASGTANALTVEAGNVRSEDVGMLLEQVEITRIDL